MDNDSAELLHNCRSVLGLSQRDFQLTLCLKDINTVAKMERGVFDVHGTTWLVLLHLLGVEDDCTDLHLRLAERVEEKIEALRREIRYQTQQDLDKKYQRRVEKLKRVSDSHITNQTPGDIRWQSRKPGGTAALLSRSFL